MDGTFIFVLLIFGLVLFLFHKFFKLPVCGAITVVTGGVKTGKSAFTLALALRNYKKARIMWRIRCVFAKIFRRKKPEPPLLYSNIPLRNIDYVPLTEDILSRKRRINEKSVVLLDEASLVADSKLIKDEKVNTELLLFFKLFGHMSHGGKLFVNSQCISDLHYALKRVTSNYYYIHHLTKLPFVSLFNVREERYSDDGSVQNQYGEDVAKSLLRVICLNRFYKKYDCYCYSVLTDSLPSVSKTRKLSRRDSLKLAEITSFRKEYKSILTNKSAHDRGDSNASTNS